MTMTLPSALEQAQHLLAEGRAAEALALLEARGARGDANALMQLAVWCLVGDPSPRDVPRARALLRQAVEIGHVDAALMEIALTANGSGAPGDWPEALRLLRGAARNDHVAAGQLTLIDQMALKPDGMPKTAPVAERISVRPDIRIVRQLFTKAECIHVASAAQDLLQPAVVVDPVTGRSVSHPVRTSHEAVIGPAQEDLVIGALNRRIAAVSGTHFAQGEPLSILRYTKGQEYRPHFDTIAGTANQRIMTVLTYLNEAFEGGGTAFPAIDLVVKPNAGDAILFSNVTPDDVTDPTSRHAGLPVVNGTKWLATRWIRRKNFDPWAQGDRLS